MIKRIIVLESVILLLPCIAQGRDLYSDTWVATDALGRELPGYAECGSRESGKTVGVFYFLWLDRPDDPVSDITDILAADPDNPPWGNRWSFHHWGEPELGYYVSSDDYVLRKHASMLSDAGVDMIYVDVSNGNLYTATYMKLCQVWQQIRDQGGTTPQLCFLARGNYLQAVSQLYDEFYSQNLYPDLWFNWKGKPLLLSPLDGLSQEVQDFFTIRDCWAWQSGQHIWSWLDHWPQNYGWDTDSEVPEQMSVCIAQHATSNIGRSFQGTTWGAGIQPPYDQYRLTGSEDVGLYFDQQWQRALEIDPELIFITGWNEWIAQRFVCSLDGCPGFLGQPTQEGDSWFVDAFNQEYSRDAEPMKGGHSDNYYFQMIANIRQYKGVRQRPEPGGAEAIIIDGDFSDWDAVSAVYYDSRGDTFHRDYDGWGGNHYVNTTGRNDIVECRVAHDAYQLYFYVQTDAALTSHTDANWMLLFIDADQDTATGWEGYDYCVNRKRNADVALLERCTDGMHWQECQRLDYRYADNQLEIAVPRTMIGEENAGTIAFDFHWADNIQNIGDITEFAVHGDSAPNRRFNYRFEKATPASYFEVPDDFEGWALTHNLANGSVDAGVLSCTITGSDAYMINWNGLHIEADRYPLLHLRMKNGSAGTGAQFYWTLSDSGGMGEDKVVSFSVVPNDTEFREYWIDLSTHPNWRGIVEWIRLDPVEATGGEIEIDYIRLQDREPACGDSGFMAADLSGAGGQRDCVVDWWDLVKFAGNWLVN